ncbi:MAG: WYL domain-containing protein [Cyanobacteria bacterium HKST-UBA02]|nr:WYL domain-containing protein [Cyanobacteria bacterium HKST-UBA02]
MSSKLRRTGAIIKLIASNPGITLSRLRERLAELGLEVSERTLAKDIDSLKEEYRLLPRGSRLRGGYVLEDMTTLSPGELDAVLDALHLLAVRLDDPESSLVLQRLAGLRPESGSTLYLRTVRQRNILEKDEKYEEHTGNLYQAIRERLPLSLVYKTPRLKDEETIEGYPLNMVFHERGWYCIFKGVPERSYRALRIDRILSMAPSPDLPVNDSAADDTSEASYLMSCGWGMTFPHTMAQAEEAETKPPVVARFDRRLAPYILEARKRHPRGVVEPVKDGTGDVEFRIKLFDAREFIAWIRSFGSAARIVSPSALVEQEKAEIRRMAETYSRE